MIYDDLREEGVMKIRLILISRTATILYASHSFEDAGVAIAVQLCFRVCH